MLKVIPLKLSAEHLKKYNAQRIPEARPLPCWAGERSMYFGLRGNVSSCCYNKTYFIGKYPEESLEAIWFGEKRKTLAEQLKQHDFSFGCHGCHELITSGNYKAAPTNNFDQLPDGKDGFPTKLDFELSNECNLECIMCRGEFSSAIRRNREKLPPIPSPYGEDFLQQLKPFIPHLKHSHFLGGEPFLIPVYQDIWKLIHTINPEVEISIQTNATILSERIKQLLESMRFTISISIDSIEKENYERIRKNSNFDKVKANMEWFHDYCQRKGTTFHLSVCPMPQNWQELPEFINYANEKQCRLFFNTVYHPKDCSFQSLSTSELDHIIGQLEQHSFPESTTNERANTEAYRQVVQHIRYWRGRPQELAFLNFEDYLEGLVGYVEDQEPEQDFMALFEDMRAKLNYILAVAEKNGNKEAAERGLMNVSYEEMYNNLPALTREHALHLFKSFIMPLPESD